MVLLLRQHQAAGDGTDEPGFPDNRFFYFGNRNIVLYPHVSLLVKNMPLDDMERCGRLKDSLPIIVAAVSAKVNALTAEYAMRKQGQELTASLNHNKGAFLDLARSLADKQAKGTQIMRGMPHGLNEELPRMGLDDDQEEYILNRIEEGIEKGMNLIDVGDQPRDSFSLTL